MRYALVLLLPNQRAGHLDVATREFDSYDELPSLMAEIDERAQGWHMASVVHIEDLPKVLDGASAEGHGSLGPGV